MKARYLTDNGIDVIKNNLDEFKELYSSQDTNAWVWSFNKVKVYAESSYDINFEFKNDNGDYEPYECENAIALYELFKGLNIGEAVINDEKFIAGFALQYGYDYFKKTMGVKSCGATLFFEDNTRRAMARNAIGRLYHRVKMTIDEDNEEDIYWLTKFAFKNNKVFRIEYDPIFDHKNISLPFFKALKRWSDAGHKIPQGDILRAHYSVLCYVNKVEIMEEEELIEYITEFLEEIENKNKISL